MRELLYSELQKELLEAGLTLSPEGAVVFLAAIDDTVPYLSRGGAISKEARARLNRFVERLIVLAREANETAVSAATVTRSRVRSGSWQAPTM